MEKLINLEFKNLEIARQNAELTNKSIKELRKKKFNKPFPKLPWNGKIIEKVKNKLKKDAKG